MNAALFTQLLSYATIFAQAATVVLAVLWFRDRRSGLRSPLTAWVNRNALTLSFVVALVAMLGSLAYSEIIGYVPCLLCWYQRIAMYPLVLILGIAAWKRDRSVVRYVVPIAIVGAVIALDHVWVQTGGASFIPCAAPGANTPACDKRFVYEFGYVTLPMMALSAFAFIIAILVHTKELVRHRK